MNILKKIILVISLIFVFILSLGGCLPGKYDEEFVSRDIKTDFCGPVMNFKFCKCAFHGEYCSDPLLEEKSITSKTEAKAYVEAEFEAWERQQIAAFKANCIATGGQTEEKTNTCYRCAPGKSFDSYGDCR